MLCYVIVYYILAELLQLAARHADLRLGLAETRLAQKYIKLQ